MMIYINPIFIDMNFRKKYHPKKNIRDDQMWFSGKVSVKILIRHISYVSKYMLTHLSKLLKNTLSVTSNNTITDIISK